MTPRSIRAKATSELPLHGDTRPRGKDNSKGSILFRCDTLSSHDFASRFVLRSVQADSDCCSVDDEEEESSSGTEAPTTTAAPVGRRKFDDEEAEDSDVLDSWDAAEDSEVEREKEKKAAEAKAKAEAEAAANKKSKAQRIAERQAERARQLAEESDSEDETEAEKRERLRRTEKEADLAHAQDLFAAVGISSSRKSNASASVVQLPGSDPNNTIDLATLPIFSPVTKGQFEALRTATAPLLAANAKKAHFVLFAQEYFKQIIKDCKSDEIKKVASALTALSNEKLKEEKAAEKGGKKTKAAKTKTSLAGVSRGGGVAQDTATYEDEDAFGDDDFM
ncbi:eukaryotic translation initiation factor 3 subunit J [Triangularia verruculosa]|uniref:Eukaryotic translation initiation factor 3 subunit J n=1 Tax=Triangularia verruculosa TaxID=2587418 RepID=A0AAN6XD57_9PEZI|nr:eukaryotic translation initiation factor 3 subunit J [Triangularia verruculosa]